MIKLQCYWPTIETSHSSSEILQAFILSDTHLLGPYRGHWLDKWRREWQMHRAFQTIISLHKPDAVFILGNFYKSFVFLTILWYKYYSFMNKWRVIFKTTY